jgi:tetratricopeptide (TPR) repeat protein
MDQKDIPLDLLPTASSRETKDVVETLVAYALITKRPAESALDIHRLVHLEIHMWLQRQKQLDQWTQRAITRIQQAFPDNNHGNRSKWRRLLPHAKYALSYGRTEKEDEASTNLAWKCATALYSDGRYNESGELFVQVMEIRKRVLGPEHPDTLTSMANLASTYRDKGRWDEAEELFVQVMETNKKKLGSDHPDTLTSMANLALTYWNQSRWDAAEELEVQVIETSKKKLGADHPDTLNSMANLSYTWKAMGRQTEALKLMDECVQIRKRVLGVNHPHFLSSSATLSAWRLEGEG